MKQTLNDTSTSQRKQKLTLSVATRGGLALIGRSKTQTEFGKYKIKTKSPDPLCWPAVSN
jgi:hypothetical protein